jgi:uncharacterized SAM-binding protein YcdF (DUF218 family)
MNVATIRALEYLVLPPGGLILLGLLGLLLWRRLLGRLLSGLALLALYLLCTPYISAQLIQGLEEGYPALSLEAARHSGAQAIVVLGGGRYEGAPEYDGDTVSGGFLARLRYGAYLARHTGLAVIPSGGSPFEEGPPEAWLAKQVLEQEFQIKVAAVEDRSRTTHENAWFTKTLLDQLQIERVLLVTHAWHMPRSMTVFRQAGVDVVAAPTYFEYRADIGSKLRDWLPTAASLQSSSQALHEYVGMLWYWLRQTK